MIVAMLHFGTGHKVRRLTIGTLDARHGPDRRRPLVVELVQGDLITIRVRGTRRVETVSVFDAFAWIIRRRVACELLEGARQKKAAKVARRATARLKRAVRRLPS